MFVCVDKLRLCVMFQFSISNCLPKKLPDSQPKANRGKHSSVQNFELFHQIKLGKMLCKHYRKSS